MSPADLVTPHDAPPEVALQAILDHGGPILLDLDETLYLSNSTEDYIDSTHPRLAALILMRLLDLVGPWRWTGGETTRDVWRVRSISILFPWTSARWNKEVLQLAGQYTNRPLLSALKSVPTTTIIATSGFRPIVVPLVAALGLPKVQIIAARVSSFTDRRAGKLHLALQALGESAVRSALVLTDSAQDIPLLDACALPLRTVWPEARYRSALSGVYLPGQYLSQIKRPGERYIVRAILQEDFALWILSSVALAALPLTHVLGLLLLLLSFWAIYERGYVDNDLIAERFESDPKLTSQFRSVSVATPAVQPWIWALVIGALAIVLLRYPRTPTPADGVVWIGVLLATHAWFWLYNRMDKGTRVWMFAGLQFARSAAFVALVPIEPVGAIALGSHVLAKWVPYYIYRTVGREWPGAPFHLCRLLFFVVLSLILGVSLGFERVTDTTALALWAWSLYRARHELATAVQSIRRLDR